jgi:hypothetical protein
MQLVTIINRTSKPLEACWDGKRYKLPPGESSLPDLVAEVAKRQNPLMGSEDPYSIGIVSLLAIREQHDDESPIEQTRSIERQNRKQYPGPRPVEVVPGRAGQYAHEISSPLTPDGVFVDPNK